LISIACFDVNPKTGKPFGSCVVCIQKNRAQHRAYSTTDNGKAKSKIQNDKPSVKKMKEEYRRSDVGKANAKERTDTDAFRLKCSKYAKTDAGKAVRKRTYQKHKLSTDLMNAVVRILKGGQAPSFVCRTSFPSEMAIRTHFSSAEGDHGKDWTVEHRIPRSAYNHDDPDDVKRCWSAANMHAMTPRENKEKHTKILPEQVAQVPVEFYPKEWAGVARTA
jgi:hypothetical protein